MKLGHVELVVSCKLAWLTCTHLPLSRHFFSVRADGSNDVTIPSAGRLRKYNHGWANWVAPPTFLSVIYSNIWNSFKRDERPGINLIITGSARLRSSAIRRRPDMKIHGRMVPPCVGDLNEVRLRVFSGRIQKTSKDRRDDKSSGAGNL